MTKQEALNTLARAVNVLAALDSDNPLLAMLGPPMECDRLARKALVRDAEVALASLQASLAADARVEVQS